MTRLRLLPAASDPAPVRADLPRPRTGRLLAPVIFLLLLGTACGAGDAADDGSTLEEALGLTDPDAAADLFADRQLDVQEQIRDCMVAEGFEYMPYVGDTAVFGLLAIADVEDLDYAAANGYGISTAVDDLLSGDVFDSAEDPNATVYEGLSPGEREAYDLALYGTTDPDQAVPGTASGCFGAALDEVFGEGGPVQLLDRLASGLDDLQDRIDADPRIIEADGDWSACMARAGYDFASSTEARTQIQQRVQALVLPGLAGGGPDGLPDDVPDDTTGGTGIGPRPGALGSLADLFRGIDYDEAALADLQQEEIAIAVADVECSEPLRRTYDEVEREYEAEFVDENRDLIDRLTGAP